MRSKLAVSTAVGSCFAAIPLVLLVLRPAGGPLPPPLRGLGAEASMLMTAPSSLTQRLEPAELPLPRVSLTMERGDTIAGKLVAAGIDGGEVPEIVDAIGSLLDPRKIQAGTTVDVAFASDGAFQSIELAYGSEPLVSVTVEDDRMVASQEEIPTETAVDSMVGEVHGSLWESLTSLDEDPTLAVSLSKLFQWQVDFAREIQPGDRFGVVVEKRTRAGQPAGYGRILAATLTNNGKQHTAIFFESAEGPSYWNEKGESQRKAFLKSPIPFSRISSRFSPRRLHPVLKVYRPHWGVDYAAPAGTPVLAAGDGKVTQAGWSGGYGRCITVAHRSGIVTKYGHLRGFASGIRAGTRVAQGQVIGYVGSTGLATGPHLDFRFQKNGKYVDPLSVVATAPPMSLGESERPLFEDVKRQLLDSLRTLEPGTKRELPRTIAETASLRPAG